MSYNIEDINSREYFNCLYRCIADDITAMHELDMTGIEADDYIQLQNAKMLYSMTKTNISDLQEFLAKLHNLVEQIETRNCWNALCDLHFNKEKTK